MGNRGPKSGASLTVVPSGIPQRIEPAAGLTASQAELWREVVQSKPVEWFGPDSAPLLCEYVRAVDMCNLLSIQVEAALADGDRGVLKDVLKLRDMESKRVAALATKLRLTQQSRYTPQAAATANKRVGEGAKPWQFGQR